MISLDTYWKDPATGEDRRIRYVKDLTPEIIANATDLVPRALKLLLMYQGSTGDMGEFRWASGWRPPSVNQNTPNAAARSKHMLGNAGDIAEGPTRRLSLWIMLDPDRVLEACGLWMEHPKSTRGKGGQTPWVHVQRVPPMSKKRIYIPR